MFCSTLSSYHRRIVWLLFNPDGYYELEFRAAIDGMTSCIPTLLIEVDDQHYTWRLSDGLHYAIDQHLDPYATVKITSDPPHVYGKEVDICMNVKRP